MPRTVTPSCRRNPVRGSTRAVRVAGTLPPVTDPQLPSGWFPDPLDRYDHRWFNGMSWTSDVSSNGERFVDPLGTSPTPGGHVRAGNRAATVAMVCGSIGLAIAWVPFLVVGGIALGIIALVAGTKGIRRSRETGAGRRLAITGLTTGGAALVLSIVGIVLSIAVAREVIDFVEPGPRFVDVVDCTVDGRDVAVTGTIKNLDDERHDYTVFVTVAGRTAHDAVDAVDPDETAEWSVDLRTSREPGSCEPDIVVNGPFPFGIETGPVSN